MDWREASMGAGVNPGWVPIVDALHAAVLDIDPDVKVDQVKEKFGGLRYYYGSDSERGDEIEALVREAESKCARTCEVCGEDAPKGPYAWGKYWINTLCEKHGAEKQEKDTPAWKMAANEGGS